MCPEKLKSLLIKRRLLSVPRGKISPDEKKARKMTEASQGRTAAIVVTGILIVSAFSMKAVPQTGKPYDLVIRGGRVIDPGTGKDAIASLGVRDGLISAIVPSSEKLDGLRTIDASGLVVAPGFIDIHAHEGVLGKTMEALARNGVTTMLGGNCGGGPYPLVMVGSDGEVEKNPSTGAYQGHPRVAGNFARLLGDWSRDQKVLDLGTALFKSSTQAARFLGLTQKGRIAVGADADLVVFNPDTISDRADFGEGFLTPPVGMEYVIVTGHLIVSQGALVPGVRAGKAIRRTWAVPGT